jgi:hypothetical protein
MNLVRLVGALPLAILSAGYLPAQVPGTSAKSDCATEARLPPIARSALCTISLTYHRPLHPMVRGIAPGGGLGAGLEYDGRYGERWQAVASAIATVRESWSAEVGGGYRDARVRLEAYARKRDLPELGFFGLGTESDLADHSNFRLRDGTVGLLGSVRPVEWLTVGARVEGLWPSVRPGRSSRFPSIETRFDESEVPGLTAQPHLVRSQAWVEFVIPPAAGEAIHQGARYRIAYASYSDRELDRFSFRRLDLEAQQRFALFGPLRRLTLHGWLSTTYTDPGNDVPFYLQQTLGGKWSLLGFHEELIGSDGTQATLRGFRNFRFRDRHLLLLQAEYRFPIWGPVDATVFAEAGKVAARRADLDLTGLQRSAGFSVSMMRGPATAMRVDIGFGGGEGVQAFFTIHREAIP